MTATAVEVCRCGHPHDDHLSVDDHGPTYGESNGTCAHAGCPCRGYEPLGVGFEVTPGPHAPVVRYVGPAVRHDVACPVCWGPRPPLPAVLDMETGVFGPCAGCQAAGWQTGRFRRGRVARLALRLLRR